MSTQPHEQGTSTPPSTGPWKERLGRFLTARRTEKVVVAVILLNGVILGLETDGDLVARHGGVLAAIDLACLGFFVAELVLKMVVFGRAFWRSGWNWFDFIVVALALIPGSGPFSVLRALRILRVLRLLTMVPSLRRVVGAFLHAIPGLGGVVAVMAIFFYVAAVLATNLFGGTHPQWFGSLGASLFSLFQIMTLESWSMGIVRPVMETHPWAWAFFVPFIAIATFTILNLFIGIIVSTMQELAVLPDPATQRQESVEILSRIESDLAALKRSLGDSATHSAVGPRSLGERGAGQNGSGRRARGAVLSAFADCA